MSTGPLKIVTWVLHIPTIAQGVWGVFFWKFCEHIPSIILDDGKIDPIKHTRTHTPLHAGANYGVGRGNTSIRNFILLSRNVSIKSNFRNFHMFIIKGKTEKWISIKKANSPEEEKVIRNRETTKSFKKQEPLQICFEGQVGLSGLGLRLAGGQEHSNGTFLQEEWQENVWRF